MRAVLLALRDVVAGGFVGLEAGHNRVVVVAAEEDMGLGDTVSVAACVVGGILEERELRIVLEAVEVMAAHIYPVAGEYHIQGVVAEDIVPGEVHTGPEEARNHTRVGESLLKNTL